MNFKALETPQKLRGGYYTPPPIAELLSRWVLARGARTILEPCCGDGVFLHALGDQIAPPESARFLIEAVEISAEEAEKSERASARLRASGVRVRVIQHDIFSWLDQKNAGRQWDAILGNPPYIRYQYFAREQRELAERLFLHARIPFSRRTNAWVFLVLACVMHLKPGGDLALVLPAELLHIQHAEGLRCLLEQEMETMTLINLREMVFPDVLQGVILLLATKKRTAEAQLSIAGMDQSSQARALPQTSTSVQPARIRLLDLDTMDGLSTLNLDQLNADTPQRLTTAPGEWMRALLSEEEEELMQRVCTHRSVQPFVAFASVDIGIVTGANDFFVVNRETLERFELTPIASPMLAKSDLIKGICYTHSDHEINGEAGKAVFFLRFPARSLSDLPASMVTYIRAGEALQLHKRYKCRIREPWYVVPYTWTSELALLKRCHLFPRLVVNELGAHSTDTAYRVRLHADYSGRARDLTVSFLNSLTFLCAELGGRHYGGGVLELVPSEIEKLLIPLQSFDESLFAHIDHLIRSHATLDELLAITDPLILGRGLGLTPQEIEAIRAAHRRLLKRRLRR